MKIILISQKNEFDQEHLNKIKVYGDVIWIDLDKTDLLKIPELYDNSEKIVALSPVPVGWEIPALFYEKL
jgi:hypothetical protein